MSSLVLENERDWVFIPEGLEWAVQWAGEMHFGTRKPE